jgi:hypothetical protein
MVALPACGSIAERSLKGNAINTIVDLPTTKHAKNDVFSDGFAGEPFLPKFWQNIRTNHALRQGSSRFLSNIDEDSQDP